MNARLEQQDQRNHEQALAAFVGKKAEIDLMLARLQALSDDHFGHSPDAWSDVAPWSTTPSCSSASPTAPSRKASMPSDQPATPEDARMIILVAIAPDGSSERRRFATQAEADSAADAYRAAGHSIYWRGWSESLQRWVSIPEE